MSDRLGRMTERIASSLVIVILRVYQMTLSPLLGPVCRFEPSCSRYMVASIEKYGVVRGVWKGLKRFASCHPWHPGGFDPP